jgi:hypothetical protein
MVVRSSLNKRRGGVVELDGTIQLKRRGPTSGRAWAATSALASIFAPRGRLIVSLFVVVSLLFGAVAATSTESTTSSAAPAPADVLVANETVAFDEVMNATALDVGEGLNVTSDDTDANAKLEEFRSKLITFFPLLTHFADQSSGHIRVHRRRGEFLCSIQMRSRSVPTNE